MRVLGGTHTSVSSIGRENDSRGREGKRVLTDKPPSGAGKQVASKLFAPKKGWFNLPSWKCV